MRVSLGEDGFYEIRPARSKQWVIASKLNRGSRGTTYASIVGGVYLTGALRLL